MIEAKLLDDKLSLSRLGEGAYWDRQSSAFYWVDILDCRINRYSFRDRGHQQWTTSKEVSYAFPSDGGLVACLADGVYDIDPHNGLETLVAGLVLPHDHRLNDAKADPAGRLWVGTINTAEDAAPTAALYVLKDDELHEIESGYVNANGKAWSPDGLVMYHADTARSTIWQYDFDVATGSVSNKRVFVHQEGLHPDGLCADAAGRIFAAVYGEARINVYSHRADLVDTVALPVPNVTSCALCGDHSELLLITTAYDGLNDAQRTSAPLSGGVFVAGVK